MPSITVVIPTYNNAPYLASAIDSILAQGFTDYEIVVVDDGSTDATPEVLEPYKQRIRYHHQRNQGLAVARNVGLALAAGEFVTYLDGDDMMLPSNLGWKHAALVRRNELGGVFSDFEVFNDHGTQHRRGMPKTFGYFQRTGRTVAEIFAHREELVDARSEQRQFYHGEVFDQLFLGNFILPSTMVFRKQFAEEVGQFVPELRTQQDYEYWLRFARRRPFGFIDDVLVRYRRHSRQLTDKSNIVRVIETSLGIIAGYEHDFAQRGQKTTFNQRKAAMLQNLAKAYLAAHRNRDARRVLTEALKRDPGLSNGVFYLLSLLPGSLVSTVYEASARRRSIAGGGGRRSPGSVN